MTKFDRDVRAISAAIDRKDRLIAELMTALVVAKGWVRHWQDDAKAGLIPTDDSLALADRVIGAAIEKAIQP